MSYVDDELLIARARRLEDNLQPLQEAYGWMHRAFEAIGLVLFFKSKIYSTVLDCSPREALQLQGYATTLGPCVAAESRCCKLEGKTAAPIHSPPELAAKAEPEGVNPP
jgi:hypothetical protein